MPGNAGLDQGPETPIAAPVYANLFGRWEGNWVGWNTAHDIRLSGSSIKGTCRS